MSSWRPRRREKLSRSWVMGLSNTNLSAFGFGVWLNFPDDERHKPDP